MPVWIEDTLHDLRYALRGLRRNPGFTLTALLAAAIAIGATTAVFSAVDRILFRPLPYGDEARLVSTGMMAPLDTNEFLLADAYFDLRRNPGPFAAVTSFQAGAIACDLTEVSPLRMGCLRVEANFLGHAGRAPCRRTAVLRRRRPSQRSARRHHLLCAVAQPFRRRSGRRRQDPQHRWRTHARRRRVAARFRDADAGPRRHPAAGGPRRGARAPGAGTSACSPACAPGVTVPQAQSALQPYFARILETVPPQFRKEITLRVRPVRDRQVGDARAASLALLGAVLAVLLIACANIANLLLARGCGPRA